MTDKQMDPAELELLDMCQGKDWFSSVGRDQYNRIVVYVNYMNGDVLRFVPDTTRDGKQVLCHFASSLKRKEDYFVNSSTPTRFEQPTSSAAQTWDRHGFDQLIDEIVQGAQAEGPAAVEELEAFHTHFRQEREDIQQKRETLRTHFQEAVRRDFDAMVMSDLDEQMDKLEDQEMEKNVQFLTRELDRLEKICGTNILGDIFFETHDKENAVTNLGSKYPDVKRRMQALYDQFGFGILYEELEL